MTSLFNSSQEIVFVLHGLTVTQTNKHIYFAFIIILYFFTILMNVTLIFTIFLEKILHDPMYVFLCNLCLNSIIGASAFYPKILYDILFDSHVITYIGCFTQMLFISLYVYCESTTLTVMAYDRYVAICKPLHYHFIMTIRKVWTLIFLTWLFSWLEGVIGIVVIASLPLCHVDIDKIYCANWAVVKLSCNDNTMNNIYSFVFTFFHFCQVIFILISYVNIIKASLRSQAERRRFMQTCLPHMISLANFVLTLFCDVIYTRYGSNTNLQALKNIMAVEFLIVPPLLNPIIYGIKLTKIRNRVRQMFNRKVAAVS